MTRLVSQLGQQKMYIRTIAYSYGTMKSFILLFCIACVYSLECHCNYNNGTHVERIYNETLSKMRALEAANNCNEVTRYWIAQRTLLKLNNVTFHDEHEVPDSFKVQVCNNVISNWLTQFKAYIHLDKLTGCYNDGLCKVTRLICYRDELCRHLRLIPVCVISPPRCAYISYHAQRYCRSHQCNEESL
jgi:hypothetical protein